MFDENATIARKQIQDRKQTLKNQPDYGEQNVFSYIFETKEHKSHQLRKRNEEMVNAIKDQFVNHRESREVKDDQLVKQILEQNKKREEEQVSKEKQRKVREMEAKFF